jgi:hypothetical protein
MKKIYTMGIAVFSFVLFAGCSKDVFKSYEERIVGTWVLEDVNRAGLGGDIDDLPFRDGTFTFNSGGGLTYIAPDGATYSGSWDIQQGATTDNGTPQSLQITAVNFTTQQVRSEYFGEIHFTATNKFKAYVQQGWHSYVFHFER